MADAAAHSPDHPALVLVAACGRNGVIGDGTDMPWRIPTDFKHFRALTMGRPIIMGRRTFQSIGKPLAGRSNIVVSRDARFKAEGVDVVASLEAALALARQIARRDGVDEIIIGGGGEIYRQAMPLADRIELTQVDLSPAGEVRFPPIAAAEWTEVARHAPSRSPNDDAAVQFVTFRRRDG